MKPESKNGFVSEPLIPNVATAETRVMAAGGPGFPGEFKWRGQALRIARILRAWRGTGPCKHGSSERYVRRHWYEVETTEGRKARIYFDRQPRESDRYRRWWLFSIERGKE